MVSRISKSQGQKNQIGLAVIGLGSRGFKAASDAIVLPQVGLVVGCEIRDEVRNHAEDELGIRIEKNWEKVISMDEIDLVYVATPNDQHADVACAVMEAGKCLFLEKPLAHNIHACRQIMEVQKSTGAFLQIGFECRYSMLYKKAKEIVDSGKVGQVRNFHMDYFQNVWENWFANYNGWKYLAERSGGIIPEKLSHYIDLFQWYTNSLITEVDVFAAEPVLSHFKINDSLHLGMRTENGAVGMITFSFCRSSAADKDQTGLDGQGKGHCVEQTLIGEKGSIYLHDSRVLDLFLYENDGQTRPYLAFTEDLYADYWSLVHNTKDELTDVVRRVTSGEPPSLSPDIAYQVSEVCFAAEESARTCKPVCLAGWR